MGNLDQPYTLFPFLYFSRMFSGMRVLIVTDHADRCRLSPGVLDLSIDFLVPESLASQTDMRCSANIKTYSNNRIQSVSDRYDVVVVDQEAEESRLPLQAISKFLASDGTLVILSWNASWSGMISSLPKHFGFPWSARGQGAASSERWYFAVDPCLRKPRHLVRWGLRQTLPASRRSAFKRWLIRSVAFILLRHHTVLIASSSKSPSPLLEILRQLIPDSVSDEQLRSCVEYTYISFTQVLLAKVSYRGSTYFVRFPLTNASQERVKNQKEICEYIHRKSAYSFVPRPVSVARPIQVPCTVERTVAGKSIERRFPRLSTLSAAKYFKNALIAMQNIHTHFGRRVIFGAEEYSAHIQTKLEYIAKRVADNNGSATIFRSLKCFLRAELDGRKVFISLTHGDFKIGNCLFDSQSRIAGIVDWDMASKSDLALFDLASFRGRSIRDRESLSLAKLVLRSDDIVDDFEAESGSYFRATKTDPVPFGTLMWIYWIDRVFKQFRYNAKVNEQWIVDNVVPILEHLSENKQSYAQVFLPDT